MIATVVYVDDEPALCTVFRAVLEETGAAVATFVDPLEALAFINDHEVAMVVCDYRMPGLNGIALLARIERVVPFFLLSGDLDVDQLAAASPRITGVLAKPWRVEALLELVIDTLAGRPGPG